MKRDLLTMLNFFSLLILKYTEKHSKFLLIFVLSLCYNVSKAQTMTHPFAANGTLVLPAGIDQVTVEGWGAGGAGGAALTGALVGRSGGGGGGGAYARGTIATSTPQTLTVNVGAANPGGAGNGAVGGASSISGYSTFLAPGGLGGNAFIADGGNPTAGAGGTGAIGNLATGNGANGTAGSSSLLGLVLSSGAGGNGGNFGAGAGGAGGAAHASLVGATLPGYNGSVYGGGGGGAISSNTLQNGGNGARGHMILTYTCKTYSLTGISAANVCLATGTTTLVQLTGTAASLPKGTYTVTYNKNNPSITGQTATMTVTTAGTGSFTAAGFTAVGNSNLVVTTLTSQDCSSTLTGNNQITVVVGAQPTITLGGTTAVCASANAQSTPLTYSATTNSPTTYSITWNASPANSFAAVTNAALPSSPISIAIPAGTAAGTYTGSITVSNIAGCISAPSNFTVTVNPLPTITLGATTGVCLSASAQNTILPYSATTNSPTTYSIVWNASPTNSFAAVTNAALPSSPINIPIPAATAAGTYTGTLTVRNANGCVSAGNNFTVTVNPLPTITLGTAGAVCLSASSQNTSLSYSATTNSPTTYSIAWNASPTNSFVAVTDATLTAGSINIAVPAATSAGTYTGTVTVKNANGCVSAGNNFTVTVNPLPTITLGTAAGVCFNASAQNTSLTYSATTNSPTTYSITWSGSPTNSFAAVTNATLTSSPISIAIPAGTTAGTYTGTLTVRNANGCVSVGNNFTVTVNPLPTITLGTAGAVCFNASAQNTSLTYSATSNTPTTYSIIWNASPTNSFAAVTNATLTAGSITIAVPAATPAGTYTGNLTVRNANGCVSASNVFTVVVNAATTITTSGNLVASCQSASVQTATLAYSATTGSPVSYSIDWATLTDQGTTAFAFTSVAGIINNITIPANTPTGTYTGTMTISNSNGCLATQAVSLTVNTSPTITTSGTISPVCQSASVQTTSLAYSATTASSISYSIDWATLTDQGTTAFTFTSGTGNITNINVPANTSTGTYNGVMTLLTANGCSVNQAVSLVVNAVVAAPTATVTQQPSCENNSGVITVTVPAAGTGYSYSIDGINFSNTSGIFTGLTAGTYNVNIKNTASGCESTSTPVTVNPLIVKTWNGNNDASWGNPANWTPSGVPLASDCVEIPDVAVNPVISGTDGSFFANRLTIKENGSLIVESTNTITVTNEVSVVGNGIFTFEDSSSLVQISNAVNSGNITYKRNSKPVKRYDLTYWSSPVTRVPAFTLHDFSPGTLGDKYYKFDPTLKWIIIYNGAEEMVKGNGYNIRAPQIYDINSTQVYGGEFVGVPNNGPISGPAALAEKSSLLGNPYPSAIYADQFIVDNAANIYGTLYFWTHNTPPSQSVPGDHRFYYNSDDFAFYNLLGSTTVGNMTGTGASTPGNQAAPSGYIAAGQGFFVKARTNQSVLFTNSMRVANLNGQFFKSAGSAAIEKHRVWLNLTNAQGAFKQLLVGYATGATNSWDVNYDAVSLDANPYLDFYSINEGKKLVIQGRALPFVVSDTIPLGYRSTIEGDFTIAIDHADGVLSTQDIYIQDNVTSTIHNLKTGGYTFTTTTGVFKERFVLRYTDPQAFTLGNEEFESSDRNVMVSVKDKNIRLQAISDQANLKDASIYDAGGKLLYYRKGINEPEWVISNFQSGPQVLVVKITLDNGRTVTRKIVFH